MFLKNKKKSIFSFEKGLTLLELIIVIAIIGIISAVSWATMNGTRNSANVQNSCEQVASMINKTRNYALSGKIVGGSVPSSFSITINGSSISIAPTGELFTIPSGVTCGNSHSYSFAVPHGGCTGCNINTTCSSTSGASRTVIVTSNSAVCQ